MSTAIVILAAGRSKRMRSSRPKVLHTLAGKPLLYWLLKTVFTLAKARVALVYHPEDQEILKIFSDFNLHFIEQHDARGTAHALQQAMPFIQKFDRVLVLLGDTPLISENALQLLASTPLDSIGLLTALVSDPTDLGRILRDEEGRLQRIVEEKAASLKEKEIKEINTGLMVFPVSFLNEFLFKIEKNPVSNEYYLTDIFKFASKQNPPVHLFTVPEYETLSVNTRQQLAKTERYLQKKQAEALMQKGVTLCDPDRFDLRGEVEVGCDVTIDVNVILEGRVKIGAGSVIGPNVILKDCELKEGVVIRAYSYIEGAVIGRKAEIGPFARIRSQTTLEEGVKIGNFVEIKNSQLGVRSKVNHLSYLGDTSIGSEVNIGAGTITANYDGLKKWETTIKNGASIGANVVLVAPVTIGERATIGAGSVITHNALPDTLTLARTRQKAVPGWVSPRLNKGNKID